MDKARLRIVAPGKVSAVVGGKCTIVIYLRDDSNGFNAKTTISSITDSRNKIVWEVDPDGLPYPPHQPPRLSLKFDIICVSVGSAETPYDGIISVKLCGSRPEVDDDVEPLEVDYVKATAPDSP